MHRDCRNGSVLAAIILILTWDIRVVCGAQTPPKCRLRTYNHKAVQTDLSGRRCWDDVQIKSCWGYCMSYELADWMFPYKMSHHPVCVHGDRKHATVTLRNCDPNVELGTEQYHYIETTACKCQVCSSEDTSCEWMPPDSMFLGGLIFREELNEEKLETDTD